MNNMPKKRTLVSLGAWNSIHLHFLHDKAWEEQKEV